MFEISKPQIEKNKEGVVVNVSITNVGQKKGKETIQVYITDLVASTARPVLELKSFQQIELDGAQTRNLTFNLSKKDFSFYTNTGELIFEPGEFVISVGPNSKELQSINLTLD